MVVVIRKNNIVLVALIFLLSVTLYSLNIGTEESTAVVTSQPLQKTILLDPGHGGEDPGAVSDYSGLKEKDVNLSIALKVKELLEQENFNVLMTRSEDKLNYSDGVTNVVKKRTQDLLSRKKMMDESPADAVVSIHLNKFKETQYFGAQTFYPSKSSESQKLAVAIQKVLKEKLDPSNKREALEKKEDIIITKNNKKTMAIVECGFLSNQEEEKKLVTKEYQDKIAEAIVEGIKNHFTPQ